MVDDVPSEVDLTEKFGTQDAGPAVEVLQPGGPDPNDEAATYGSARGAKP